MKPTLHRVVFPAAILAALLAPDASSQESPRVLILPGERLTVAGRPGFVFLPTNRSSPQPWVMYAPTLAPYPDKNERWMHERFLDAGVAVAGVDVGEAYGGTKGREGFDA